MSSPAEANAAWVCKSLSANDVGATGSHQAGLLVPKASDVLDALPPLNPDESNPSIRFRVTVPELDGAEFELRLVYYNVAKNEYRLTGITALLRELGAREGDSLCFLPSEDDGHVLVRLSRAAPADSPPRADADHRRESRTMPTVQPGGQMSESEFVPNDPDVSRIVDALADTGYSFKAAVADIIDNSISHGEASVVSVYLGLNAAGTEAEFWIADNGRGMDRDALLLAMRYGAPRREDAHSLGKFGVGLKTASTSFARRLVVLSRAAGDRGDANMAAWDLDKIAETGQWTLERGMASDEQQDLFEDELEQMAAFSGEPEDGGTVVKWEKVHGILLTKSGATAVQVRPALRRVTSDLREHLEMVFHRFLDPADGRARDVRIVLNGDELEAWDPFLTTRGMKPEDTFEIGVDPPELTPPALRVVILPSKGQWEAAGFTGDDETYAKVGIERQGIYLYRENRMLTAASWMNTGKRETHINTLRVELDFTEDLDELFSLDMKKSQVNPRADFTTALEEHLVRFRREADRRSRKKENESAAGAGRGGPSEATIRGAERDLSLPAVETKADGTVLLSNRQGKHTIIDEKGAQVSDIVRIIPAGQPDDDLNIVREPDLPNGVLWEPTLANGKTQVRLNVGHDWYVKAYVPNATNAALAQAIDFLLFALGQAEINNTNELLRDAFEDFRIDVSRNLRRLVRDLP